MLHIGYYLDTYLGNIWKLLKKYVELLPKKYVDLSLLNIQLNLSESLLTSGWVIAPVTWLDFNEF